MAGNNVRRSCLLLLLPRDPKTHDSSADAPRARRSPSLFFTTEKHKTTPARLRVQIAANRFFFVFFFDTISSADWEKKNKWVSVSIKSQ